MEKIHRWSCMAIGAEVLSQIAVRHEVLGPYLNERQRRLALAVEARLLGHGGVRAVARAAGVSETTVRAGVFELEAGEDSLPLGRVRRAGGGRKPLTEHDSRLLPALLALVEPDERGDPMSPLRWTTKSVRHLADELTKQGHPISAATVGRLLHRNGFSLQANAKTLEGEQHPDRDAQFSYVNEQIKDHQQAGEPVISVDAKKKEQLGLLPAGGREWRPRGDPVEVVDHSFFTGPQVEQALPYGVYDLAKDTGWVNVGVDHDTAAFAVASIRRWWQGRGCLDYPHATRLLITADAGGSNCYRFRLWKAELATLAAETGLTITVCHFPPGTSKWNKIEHRLFSHITMNWRCRPLASHEVVVQTIAATTTRTGLQVNASLDTRDYPLGIAVTAAQLQALPITAHAWHGAWNYTIGPPDSDSVGLPAADSTAALQARTRHLQLLADPRLTGMTRDDLDHLASRLAADQAAQIEQRCYHQRGGPRQRAPGAGATMLLTAADRVLVTVIYLRQVCSQKVLAELLAINPTSIGNAIADTRTLLEQHKHAVTPTKLRCNSVSQLLDFLDGSTPPTPAETLPDLLTDPRLTGMTRPQLTALLEQLRLPHNAQVEHRRYHRRGRHPLPGTRGGVFKQKLTDPERVLAAILYQRQACTRQVLADLFQVSPRTIGSILIDIRPLLDQAGFQPTPAGIRYRSATVLREAISRDTPT
jgi:transposase